MSNTSYHHGDLKNSLILAAQNILREEGADALSLRAIAADVGVSHMAPYSHFKNKKELFQAVAAAGFEELGDRMLAASESLDEAKALILAYGSAYVEFAVNNAQLYRVMLGQVEAGGRRKKSSETGSKNADNPVVSAELEESSKRPFRLLRDAFAMENDNSSEVMAQALGAWAMVHGMASLIVEGHIRIPEGMEVNEFLSMAAVQSRLPL